MKHGLNILFCTLLIFTTFACSNDESKLENKWQLRKYQYANGTIVSEDSVFYNFMKGSFSAICILPNGKLTSFFGNYSFNGDKIFINLLPYPTNDSAYIRYINWPDCKSEFNVNKLSSTELQISNKEKKMLFRKY